MDYGFIARPQQNTGMQSLSDVLNMARGATALQRERGTLLSDIEKGKAESARAVTEAGVAAQTAQPRVEQQAAATGLAKTTAARAEWHLGSEQAQKAFDIVGGLAQDPAVMKGDSDGIVDALGRAEEQMRAHKLSDRQIRVQMAPLYTMAATKPGAFRQMLDNMVRGGAGVSAQANVINAPATMVQTPQGAIAPMQLQPGAQGGVQPVPISALQAGAGGVAPVPPGVIPPGIPPAQRQTVDYNPVTRSPTVTEKNAAGDVVDVRPAPSSAGVPRLAPGEPEDIPILTTLRSTVNNAAAKVPESRFNNSQVLKLVDETDTGRRAELVRTLKGPLAGIPWETKGASKFDQLGHFIALEAANNAAAMNAGTDAARALAEQKTASTGWTPDAIKSAVKINDSLATGLAAYNKGMEKAIAANGNNILAVRPFQNAWSQAFDPNVYRYANALESGDKAEMVKILGKEGSPERKAKAEELLKKRNLLFRLSEQGQ